MHASMHACSMDAGRLDVGTYAQYSSTRMLICTHIYNVVHAHVNVRSRNNNGTVFALLHFPVTMAERVRCLLCHFDLDPHGLRLGVLQLGSVNLHHRFFFAVYTFPHSEEGPGAEHLIV